MYRHPNVDYGKTRRQVLVPTCLRDEVMKTAHDSIVAGHMGIRRTLDRITTSFYWPGIYADVKRYCSSCDTCQRTVKRGSVPKAPLGKMPLVDVPFKRVAVDLVGPISPPSEDGHRYILTLVDFASRYPEATALKNIETETVAEALRNMYCRLGFPEEVLSDLGTQFISQCMTEVSRLLGIKQMTGSPYHPESQGLVERFNGTLKTILRRLCIDQPKQWHRFLGPLLFAYREVPQESTGFSPFELLYGRSVRGPMQILKDLWTEENEADDVRSSYRYVFELQERLDSTLQLAREQLSAAQVRQKFYKDKKSKPRVFKVDEEALILVPSSHNKLLMQWKGPFKITERLGAATYKVNVNGKVKTYHVNLLKKYVHRIPTQAVDTSSTKPEVAVGSVAVIADDDGNEEELIPLYPPLEAETVSDVIIGTDLSDIQERQLKSIFSDFGCVFSYKPGKCTVAEHVINLTSNDPVVSKPYAVPYGFRESLQNDLEEMLRDGIIRHSSSPYASPIVIVRKKCGGNRICIDYRKLNRVTEFDPQPLIPIQDVISRLSNDRFFTRLDMTSSFWQIPVRESDIPKTAFVTHDAKFEFTRTPFGMKNSGSTLSRCLRKLLGDMPQVTTYLDDIVIHTKDFEQHVHALREVMSRLQNSGLTIKPSKCQIACSEIEVLGHVVRPGEIRPIETNVDKILSAERPKTKKEVRSFLGITGFYRQFIADYATKAAALTDLLKKGKPNKVEWGEPQDRAYCTLRSAIATEPILRLPDPNLPFILRTDASDVGLGAVLCQQHVDGIFPVAYASRKLLDREKRYSVIERECLAIVFAVRKFSVYLMAVDFILQTDHEPLAYLNKAKYESSRVTRWALYLQSFNFRVEPIKGKENVTADFLSRTVRTV